MTDVIEKADRVKEAPKRGRPRKSASVRPPSEAKGVEWLRAVYASKVRTYYFDFTFVTTDRGLEVTGIKVSLKNNKPMTMERAIQNLGSAKVFTIVKKEMIKQKLISRLDRVWFSVPYL
jgi:hypothetical protein